MGYIRYSSTYHNTTGAACVFRIDIVDSSAASGITTNFMTDKSPTFTYAGLSQTLNPGVFHTEVAFGMFIRSVSVTRHGTVYGDTTSFINDIFLQPEGTYFAKVYKNDVLQFIGDILPDQSSFEDNAEPYLLKIKAADGMYRWGTEDYVSYTGQIVYKTLRRESQYTILEFSPNFVTIDQDGNGLVGSEWVVVEHFSNKIYSYLDPLKVSSGRSTTYARLEQYSVLSPGTGWVDQGGALWAKALAWSNEIIETADFEYHLTRDIDDTTFRPLSEVISRAMALIPSFEEYGADPMYDIVDTWYERNMFNLTDDPLTMIAFSEVNFFGKKWRDVIDQICRHRYMRCYYSTGRFHFEQISERGETTIKRYKYNYLGASLGNETVNLDLAMGALGIKTGEGGSYKIMGALKKVVITQKLDGSNLLDRVNWDNKDNGQGGRYIARIKKPQADTRFLLLLRTTFEANYDSDKFFALDDTLKTLTTSSHHHVHIRVRVKNINTGVTWHLTPDVDNNDGEVTSSWTIDHTASWFNRYVELKPDLTIIWNKHIGKFALKTLTADLPGNINDSFDIYVSVQYRVHFLNPELATYWTVDNPTKYEHIQSTYKNSLTTVNTDEEPINAGAERAYEVANNVNNSLSVEMDVVYGDQGVKGEHILIKTSTFLYGAQWIRSFGEWSRYGTGTPVEILMLLAKEIMSIRTLPRRIYSGSFLTTLMTTENRLNRNGLLYLPLQVSIDTDKDAISGDFINIDHQVTDDGDLIVYEAQEDPDLEGGGLGTGAPDIPADIEIVFETNQIIQAGVAYSSCLIVNTALVFIQAGTQVKIINPENSAQFEIVTLLQDINPSDTVMYFGTYTFLYTYPDASYIIPIIDEGGIEPQISNQYYFYKENYSATTIDAPNFVFLTQPVSPHTVNKRYKVFRNGVQIYYQATAPTSPAHKVRKYSFDYVARQWIFWRPLNNEEILIIAW